MSSALQDWNPQGRPDAQGGMIGGSAAVRVTDQKDGLLANTLCDNTKYGSQRVRDVVLMRVVPVSLVVQHFSSGCFDG